MNIPIRLLAAALVAASALAAPALADDRYATRPPVVLSPDLSASWVMQLHQPGPQVRVRRVSPLDRDHYRAVSPHADHGANRVVRRPVMVQPPVSHASAGAMAERPAAPQMNPIYLPQQVAYGGGHAPGTIIVDTGEKFLYLVGHDGQARRYGVGVGKEGFGWTGSERITRKAEWPDWRPPAQMIARERANGRILPPHVPGGPENPLGARALYLGSTLYRIHGTNQPWTIGQEVSSGCIRMRNEDVVDLYERVPVGARVIVL